METLFSAICIAISAGSVNVSDNLNDACTLEQMPRVITDGSRFDSRGIGGELNLIAANLDTFGIDVPETETADADADADADATETATETTDTSEPPA